MKTLRLISSIIVASAITACSNGDQRLCEASIKGQLLNPETAEIMDFKSISREEAVSRVASDVVSTMPNSEYLPEGAAVGKVAEGVDKEYSKETSFYGARVRAEGKLGNTVTSTQTCAVESGTCSCTSAEALS